ncbi:MAG: DUF624 domain-containing protein [Lachnospiraceae bacterium]|nr:DUF624 domain-containing protein [Lachnospiraceae bacterium]MBO4787896.1 DUF624 domain-containing protein [Lachnospiraceae bacterium]MBQ2032173.1 DUF624 domain-containing protein [Lachnospiraceae bacterium]MBQ3979507.1 DUF624 domain-containing protein [Lachnospiraceae bacterium]MCR5376177.1 DUF624 domain-containing protein [Lachnospiraceae bacterium]
MNAGDIFNSENKFFSFMNKAWDVLVLNLYFILTVLLGIGPAATALYYAIVKNVRRSRSYATTEYFRAFKNNFKQGLIIGLIQIAAGASAYICYEYAMAMRAGSTIGQIYFAVWVLFTLLFIFISMYVYPILSRFTMTVRKTLRMSFVLSLRHLPTTLVIAVILFLSGILCYLFPPAYLFIFGVYTLLKSFLMEKILKRYTPKPEEGDTATDAWYLE